ncbi:hypothetical protein [Streptomyces sp. NPDC058855]|uniref:hypothetical protein n=1 Tax=Streptomyces sp. NPDC058855 TaxID=3346651 RepID=UPI0036C99FBC
MSFSGVGGGRLPASSAVRARPTLARSADAVAGHDLVVGGVLRDLDHHVGVPGGDLAQGGR